MAVGYSADQIRAAEKPHLANHEPLMARAAAGLAAELRSVIGERRRDGLLHGSTPTVLVLAGPGDNGGDALFAAAELAAKGADVLVLPVLDRTHEDGTAAALRAGARMVTAAEAVESAAQADVIVDGIVGIGSRAGLHGPARAIVAALLPVLAGPDSATVVAVDIPSGIGCDDGTAPDPAVLPADVTVTFGGIKAGLLRSPAKELAGRVKLVEVGIERQLAKVEPALRTED